jgi:hypothetical protein
MPHDWTATTNPLQSAADFTYSVTPTTLTIKDSGKGKKSVVEDLPAWGSVVGLTRFTCELSTISFYVVIATHLQLSRPSP